MIQSTLGRPPRHETYKQYPHGLHPLIYDMATLLDKGEWNEDNKEMYIRMFTDRLREERDPETLEYYRSINNNRTERYKNVNHGQEEKDEEDKIMKEFTDYKNRNKIECVEYHGDEEKKFYI